MIHCIPAPPQRAERRHAALERGARLALAALAASVSCLPASDLDSYRSGHGAVETGQGTTSSAPAALQGDVSHFDGNLPPADAPGQGNSLTPQSAGGMPATADGSGPDAAGGGHGSG